MKRAGPPDIADLVITPEILKLVATIDEFKGAWQAIGRVALSVRIIELCRERGRVTIGEIAQNTGASRNTMASALEVHQIESTRLESL